MRLKLIIFGVFVLPLQLLSQSLPVGTPLVEDYLRRQQLLGKFDPTFSFNYRPINLTKNGLKVDSTIFKMADYFGPDVEAMNGKLKLTVLPAEFRMSYDLRHPDSRNDGAMIRSRGLQTYLSAGFYAELGPLSIQFKPEYIWAENLDYLGFPAFPRHYESTWEVRYLFWNRIDTPERFGNDAYYNTTWGQSHIRLNKWGLSLGISTENLWWGPSKRNSIMMSNNAAGFPHLTFNTQRPIKTAIGGFEWTVVTGQLEASGYNPPQSETLFRGQRAYVPKPDDSRYYQAFSFTYSPKWVKGLSLGVTRWVQQYSENARETGSYFPIFQNLFRKNDREVFGVNLDQDQAAGIFGRWLWQESQTELYFEFYKNDASLNLRDLLVDTDHSRALTVGIHKLFPIPASKAAWQFNFEWTQMSQTESGLLRNSLSWYIHGRVRHGYTHNGEVLGSALGPGGNAQYMEIAHAKGLTRIGGALERRVHNNDFAVQAFPNDFTRYWVDYNILGFYETRYKDFLVSAHLLFTNSLNYQWEVKFDVNNPARFPDTPGVDRTNWNFDLKLAYIF